MEANWLSTVPPLLAISVSLATRRVVPALAASIIFGALLVSDFSALDALTRLGNYGLFAVTGGSHLGILGFSLLLGALMGQTQGSGEQEQLARLATRYATTRGRGQLATWALGLIIFFDDYLNTLVVGSTMRPIYDRLRISREKLAYLVDSTAAPVTSLAIVSSWIAVEVGYINEQYRALGIEGDGLVIFVESLPYRFYPWFTLVFALAVCGFGRDFGPMLAAERRAMTEPSQGSDAEHRPFKTSGDVTKNSGEFLAALPIICLVLYALIGMVLDGYLIVVAKGIEPTLRSIFEHSRSHVVLIGSALVGNIVAMAIALGIRKVPLRTLGRDIGQGMKRMLLPCGILMLAWSLSSVCRDLGTASYLIARLGHGISPEVLPAAIFVIAAMTSFATGTSWGTMAILFPIVVPLAFGLSSGREEIMLGSISSILAGSVWGDHCSPISDTTIMSSLVSGCDHMSHVKTQLPYAVVVGAVSLVLGDVATGLGFVSPWVALFFGSFVLVLIVRFFGRPPFPTSNAT